MIGNLFDLAGIDPAAERFSTVLQSRDVRIERIVSYGQASPPGFWHDQAVGEWVVLLAGAAALRFDGDAAALILRPGDHAHIAAGRRHRVDWTAAEGATIWLAVHLPRANEAP